MPMPSRYPRTRDPFWKDDVVVAPKDDAKAADDANKEIRDSCRQRELYRVLAFGS